MEKSKVEFPVLNLKVISSSISFKICDSLWKKHVARDETRVNYAFH